LRVLTFLSYYLPGYKGGGPIRTIENMVNSFKDKLHFLIITRDRDLGSTEAYNNIEYNKWNFVNHAQVRYLAPSMFKFKKLKPLILDSKHDVLYLNSFFSFYDSILPLLIIHINKQYNKKIIIAPRGEFSKGAINIKSLKKKIFIIFSKLIQLHKNVIWQASSHIEENDIKNIYGKSAKIIVAPDLISYYSSDYYELQIKLLDNYIADENTLNTFFYSRISYKKNLTYLIEILTNVKRNIILDIYGPIEDKNYWDECKKMINLLPGNIKCNYLGILTPENVSKYLYNYDLFLFPTLGENFGHVIFESMIAGTPVFISDQTPWGLSNNFGTLNILSLDDKENWINCIEKFDKSKIIDIKKRTLKHAFDYSKNNENINTNLNLFYE
jgi:glycosyltransferase involved in cell wall biosynthesis